MTARRRIAILTLSLPLLLAPLLGTAPASAAVDRALTVGLTGSDVLTLPADDGLRDATTVWISGAAGGAIDLVATPRGRGHAVRLAEDVPLRHRVLDWRRTIRVPISALGLGTWTVTARRVEDHAVRAHVRLRVGSGVAVAAALTPSQRTLYPFPDGVLDAVDVAVAATDETGTDLPVSGRMRVDTPGRDRRRALDGGTASLPVVGLPIGPARLTATVRGPAGRAVSTSTSLVLAPTGAGTMRLATSSDTVQPVVDGLLDGVALTVGGTAVASSPAAVTGTLTITRGGAVVRRWQVPDGTARTVTWDGRVGGAVVPGAYTATLTLRGPEGPPSTRTRSILVSRDHLPYRVRALFAVADGNQQGLAVRDGQFYIATDIGDGASRIDVFDGSGTRLRSLGPVMLGHGAELSYSTTTGRLYAANGGPTTPTTVWALDPDATDPASAVTAAFDLGALGHNGMVAVDDAGGRLLVFSGDPGAYTLTSVGFDGVRGASLPIAVTGMPQGIEMVGSELWIYTSLRDRNRIARYAVTGDQLAAATTGAASFDLMNPGEGQGLAFAAANTGSAMPGWIYVGAHGPNRVDVLEPVADE